MEWSRITGRLNPACTRWTSWEVGRRTVEVTDQTDLLGPVPSSLLLCQGLKLHFNEENVVTLKHMVARLLGLD